MIKSFFVSDLHGSMHRYEMLFSMIRLRNPEIVFIGGDIFSSKHQLIQDFTKNFLRKNLNILKNEMKELYPEIFLILGNDDPKSAEEMIIELENEYLFYYMHHKMKMHENYKIFGYSIVPPTPFRFKDWEKYDKSIILPPDCIPPESGIRTYNIDTETILNSTIEKDLGILFDGNEHDKTIALFHSPPNNTELDCIWNKTHVGSMAIKEFINSKKPYLTLHGHIHESSEVTGKWLLKNGRTTMINAAYSGKELSLISFDLENPEHAERLLL